MKSVLYTLCTVFSWFMLYPASCEEMSGSHDLPIPNQRNTVGVDLTMDDENSSNGYGFDINGLLKSHLPAFDDLLTKAARQLIPESRPFLNQNVDNKHHQKTGIPHSIAKKLKPDRQTNPFIVNPPNSRKHSSLNNNQVKLPSTAKHLTSQNANEQLYAPYSNFDQLQTNTLSDENYTLNENELTGSASQESTTEEYLEIEFIPQTNPINLKNNTNGQIEHLSPNQENVSVDDIEFEEPAEITSTYISSSFTSVYNMYEAFSTYPLSTAASIHHVLTDYKTPFLIYPTSSFKSNDIFKSYTQKQKDEFNPEAEFFIPVRDPFQRNKSLIPKLHFKSKSIKSENIVPSTVLPFLEKHSKIYPNSYTKLPTLNTNVYKGNSSNRSAKKETRLPKQIDASPIIIWHFHDSFHNSHTPKHYRSRSHISDTFYTINKPILSVIHSSESLLSSSFKNILELETEVYNRPFENYIISTVDEGDILTPSWNFPVKPTATRSFLSMYMKEISELRELFTDNYYIEDKLTNTPLDNFLIPSSYIPASLWLPNPIHYNVSQWSVSNQSAEGIERHLEESRLATTAIIGIVFGIFGFFLIICFIIAFFYRRGTTIKKVSDYDENFSYWDDNLTLSYVNGHIELPKETSEEMVSLDNDSFLKSLEKLDGITIQNYWAHNSKNTQV